MQAQIPRIVMIGDSSVGKTSLVQQLCKGTFTGDTCPTVTTNFYVLHGDPNKNQSDIQLWDTAGAEKYRALNSVYYHNAMGGLLVFDLTNRLTFEGLSSWIEEFSSLAQPGALIVLVGNKSDMIEELQVTDDEAEKWANVHGVKYFPTSAKEGTNISELSDYILFQMPQKAISFLTSTVNITQPKKPDDKKESVCC